MSDDAQSVAIDPGSVSVTPEPSDEELAAILVAYGTLWPKPSGARTPGSSPRWRYAGRWWSPRPRYGGWR